VTAGDAQKKKKKKKKGYDTAKGKSMF